MKRLIVTAAFFCLAALTSKADDINDRLSEHMIIVTWKEEEIDFPKKETEILDHILELCDGLLINNKQNDWAFFVEICE